MDFNSALQKLTSYRPRKNPTYKQTFNDGLPLLENNSWGKQNDGWDFLESLALAAIDLERFDISDRCIQLLQEKFPDSPRVDCLAGIRLEATEAPDVVLSFYDESLQSDPSNHASWRRKVTVLKGMGRIDKAVEELSELLDTFYADVDGWVELAEIYYLCHQYTYALQSLSHALILAPQNPFYVLQFAEIAYAAEDIPLAIKMYLVAVDMTDDEDSPVKSIPTNVTLRAWYGVKLCTNRLSKDSRLSNSSASHTQAPKQLKPIDELALERLRLVYKDQKGQKVPPEEELLGWISSRLSPA